MKPDNLPYPFQRGPDAMNRIQREFRELGLMDEAAVCRHFGITAAQYHTITIGKQGALDFALLLAEGGVDVTYWLVGRRAEGAAE